ncbi:MAG: 16S rRNA (uracil(1498)-N(3))-methyltransferase [Ignavibacteriales bacterium]
MSLHRVFVDPCDVSGGTVRVNGPSARHMTRVLRMAEGDRFIALDGAGGAWIAEIRGIDPAGGVTACVTGESPEWPEPLCRVTLYQSLPKADKMDLVVQKCTEVGVKAIVPVLSERSVIRLDGERTSARSAARVERWRRIARESAEQSGRRVIPRIEEITPLESCHPAPGALFLIMWEAESPDETGVRLKDALPSERSAADVAILVGPEGGLTADEVRRLVSRGAVSVSLGPRILRTETAGMIAAALVLHHWGDLG